MKAILVQLPHEDRVPTAFPLGIANIATSLKEIGIEVDVFDIFALGYSTEQTMEYLKKGHWDIFGVSAFSTQYRWAKWITSEFKKIHPDAVIVMGGPLPTFSPETVLRHTGTDVCVISEGEETIKDLAQNLADLSNVHGVVYKDHDGSIKHTPSRPYLKNLDAIPFSDYSIFPTEIYFKSMGCGGIPGIKAINIVSSRGCPFKCTYCSRTFSGARYRSVDNIIDEIKELKARYGIKAVLFNDELVIANKKRAHELCDKIGRLNVYWGCQGRANIVDIELLRAMKASGCMTVGFGVESGSQKILDAMEKRVTVEQNEAAIKNTLKVGMVPVVQMIYGYPGEDATTLDETVQFFKRVKYYPPLATGDCHFNTIIPLPGSPLYGKLIEEGRIGSENDYLDKLDQGYNAGAPAVMNLTDFPDESFARQKEMLQNIIRDNFYKAGSNRYFDIYFKQYMRLVEPMYAVEGIAGVRRLGGHYLGLATRKIARKARESLGWANRTQ